MTTSLIPAITADHMQLASLPENESFLPDEIILEIFSHLNLQELATCRLIASRFSKIEELVLKKIKQCMTTFGKEEWEMYFGEVGEAPPLPPLKVFQEIYKTYMLVLLPETVDGKLLTFNLFKTLAKNPKGGGHVTEINIHFRVVGHLEDFANLSLRWVLFPKNILEGTKGKSYWEQIKIVAAKKGVDYEITSLLEAVVSIASRYVQSGERLFSDCYTRCQETVNLGYDDLHLVVGGFGPDGLEVDCSVLQSDFSSVAAVRK